MYEHTENLCLEEVCAEAQTPSELLLQGQCSKACAVEPVPLLNVPAVPGGLGGIEVEGLVERQVPPAR